jgi:hypothetical protein
MAAEDRQSREALTLTTSEPTAIFTSVATKSEPQRVGATRNDGKGMIIPGGAAPVPSKSGCGGEKISRDLVEVQADGAPYAANDAIANEQVDGPDVVHTVRGEGEGVIALGGTPLEPSKSGCGENEADGAHGSLSVIDAIFSRCGSGMEIVSQALQTNSMSFKAQYADDVEIELCLRAVFKLENSPTYLQSTVDAALRRRRKKSTTAPRTRIVHPPMAEAPPPPPRSKKSPELEESQSRPTENHETTIGSGLAQNPVTAYYLSVLCTEAEGHWQAGCGNALLADARVHALVGILEMQQLGHWPSLGSGADASTRNSALIRAGALGRKRCEKASLLWEGGANVALEGWSAVATRTSAAVDGPRASDAVLEDRKSVV